jgi:hypothetical protein
MVTSPNPGKSWVKQCSIKGAVRGDVVMSAAQFSRSGVDGDTG